MELYSVLCVSLDGRSVWGRMDICICVAESLHCPPDTTTALLTGYTPIQDKKFEVCKKKKKKNSPFKVHPTAPPLGSHLDLSSGRSGRWPLLCGGRPYVWPSLAWHFSQHPHYLHPSTKTLSAFFTRIPSWN